MQGQARRWYGPRGCVCRLHCCKFAFHAESLLNVCTRGPLAALLGSSARFLLVHRPPRAAAARTPRAAAACTASCMNMLKGAKELAGAHPTTPSRPATGRVHCTEEFPHADLIATCCIHPCVHRTQVVDAARQRIHIGAHGKRVVAHTPLALFVLTQALAALSQEPQETDRFYDEQLRTDGTRLLAIGGLFHTPQPSVSPNLHVLPPSARCTAGWHLDEVEDDDELDFALPPSRSRAPASRCPDCCSSCAIM